MRVAEGIDMAEQQHGVPVVAAGDDGPAQEGALGSRTHVRRTLARAEGAMQLAHERVATSRSPLAWASTLVSGSSSLVQASTALRAELRTSVTAYVRHLRDEGVPPERMLVLVKSTLRESTPADLDALEARALMEDVVRWSVDAYYEAA